MLSEKEDYHRMAWIVQERARYDENAAIRQGREMVAAAKDRVREQTRGFRHIVGLSDDLLANTPIANARALVDEARRE